MLPTRGLKTILESPALLRASTKLRPSSRAWRVRLASTMAPFSQLLPSREGLALSDPNLLGAGSFIDGAFCRARSSGSDLIVTNPANGGVVRRVVEASDADVERALAAADSAFSKWRTSSLQERSSFMRRWHELVVEHKDDLARLITLENGKPLKQAAAEVDYAASFIDWNVLSASQAHGSNVVRSSRDVIAQTIREPVGVCMLVTPWNFPAAMLLRKAAPAIAAGCAVVAKPSELTPLTALALGELARRADVPDGLFNVLATSRSADVTDMVLETSCVRLVSFTGSTRVGKLIAAKAAERILHTSLELGGHAPFIVYDDADLELAVEGLVGNKMRGAGQTCLAVNRVFVQRGPIYDEFCNLLEKRMGELVMGNGLDPDADYGPLIGAAAVQRVSQHVSDAVSQGATMRMGPKDVSEYMLSEEDSEETEMTESSAFRSDGDDGDGDAEGNFFPATLLTDVTDDMLIAREETFGPVVGILPFDDEESVVQRCNRNTNMGLAAYLYTKDMGRAVRTVRDLQFGMIGVNEIAVGTALTPFGGVKESGVGREGGVSALDTFTEVKYSVTRF